MSVTDISVQALKLPVRSRALLADLLLDSLDEGSAEDNDRAWLELAKKRDAAITKGLVSCKTHAEIVETRRRSNILPSEPESEVARCRRVREERDKRFRTVDASLAHLDDLQRRAEPQVRKTGPRQALLAHK